MNWNSTALKARLLSFLYAASIFLTTSAAFAAEEEEEAVKEPIWVMSWAAFIFFAGATIIICVFFSKRKESLLSIEDQKKCDQLRADRLKKRQKEARMARMQTKKK